jgi:hypothetical protein
MEKFQSTDIHWLQPASVRYQSRTVSARPNVLAKAAGFQHKRAAFDVRWTPAMEPPAVLKQKAGVEDAPGKRW